MKKYSATEKAAFKAHHPRKPADGYKVMSCGIVVFENASIALCWHFIRTNHLTNTKPIAK